MKKFALCCLLSLLLLSGCGKKAFDPAQVSRHYADCPTDLEYTVTTHGSVYGEYRLSCLSEGDRSVVTVLEPKSVAGITAEVLAGQGTLRYEDVILEGLTPPLPGLAPMDSLQGVMDVLARDVPFSVEEQADTVTLEYHTDLSDTDRIIRSVTLQRETLAFLTAELYLNDTLVLTVRNQSVR